MKKLLLLVSALIFVFPVWAEDAPPAPTVNTPASGEAAPVAEPDSTTPDTVTTACTKTCVMMNCPPPSGPVKLCCPVSPYTQTCP